MKKNKSDDNKKRNFSTSKLRRFFKSFFKKLLILIILPLYLFIFKVIKSKDRLPKKILKSLGIFIFVIPFTFIVDLIILVIFLTIFYWGGIIKSPIEIVGRSMMPTLKDKQWLYMHPYNDWMFWKGKINRGDIVTFQDNNMTGEKTFVKRVVGLPNEEIELRNGFVYINGKPIDEPYVFKYRATYGGKFLPECKQIKIPSDNVFVMGDNRTGSNDSREFGLIPISDVHTILHHNEQDLSFAELTSKSNMDVNTTLLNSADYLKLVNKLRQENNLKPLKLNDALSKSAELRANAMLKFNDLSWAATISGYPMSRSMADAGYYNIVSGEYPITGYYDANDLYNYVTEVSKNTDFLLNKDYQDIGIAAVIGDLNNCPVQLVVQQMAGYVPPNYSKDLIDDWQKSLDSLRSIQSGWQKLKQYPKIYDKEKSAVDRINDIISQRINMIEGIIVKMKANQWLSSEQDKYTRVTDKKLNDEENSIADKLNNIF